MNVQLIDKWFPLTTLKTETIIGGFSWTSIPAKMKWILSDVAWDYGAGWVSPADIARDYLNIKYGKQRRRVSTKQYQTVCITERSQPLYAVSQVLEDAVYIDLKSAYWSILKVVGWDVDYFPGQFLSRKSSVLDFPLPAIKLARNSLVSLGLQSPMKIWTGSELKFVNKHNPLMNKVLWYLVQDVLHGVAGEMESIAAYINTDGYMIDRKDTKKAFDIIGSWGLPCSIRYEGRAEIYGAGQYNITGKRWIEPRKRIHPDVRKIDQVNVGWLKPRFAKFASIPC